MSVKWSLSLLFVFVIFISSCKKDEPIPVPIIDGLSGTFELEIKATMNGAPVIAYAPFTNVNQHRATIEDFRFYLGTFTLKNASAAEVQIKDVAYFDLLNGKNKLSIKLPEGDYTDLSFYVGVPDALNGTNNPDFTASVYGQDHPLSLFNAMYWTWASGYIFLKVEGKIDTSATQDQAFDRNYFYHVGLQDYFLPKHFPGSQIKIKKGETTKLVLKIEYNDLFRNSEETINMAVNSFTHTTDNAVLAEKVIENFRDALLLE